MTYKLDTVRPIFVGANPAREGTVVDAIRRAVGELDTGEGVFYETLEAHLLANYTPAKSQNYNASFIKSYVRDALGKYGYLSHENEGHGYSFVAGAAPREPRAKRVPKSQQEVLAVATFILSAGEVENQQDVVNTNITIEDVAQELHRRKAWVEKRVSEGVASDLLRLENEDGRNLVYLTEAGFTAASSAVETTPVESEETAESTELESA